MERIISVEEKVRRAEEIYARRKNNYIPKERIENTVRGKEKKNFKLLKKIIIQILICALIYCIFYLIKNTNYLFSETTLNKIDEVLSYDKKHDCSLVKIDLRTGRHHQIRVQFASRGDYLLGDKRYGVLDDQQICLFCYYLAFLHPVRNEWMEFQLFPEKKGYWSYFSF